MTIIWLTEEYRRRTADARRERIERDQSMMSFGRWLLAHKGHHGPVTVPKLTAETEARLLEVFRQERPWGRPGPGWPAAVAVGRPGRHMGRPV